jgi:hypothetical protein
MGKLMKVGIFIESFGERTSYVGAGWLMWLIDFDGGVLTSLTVMLSLPETFFELMTLIVHSL